MKKERNLIQPFLVPGLPHLLAPELNPSYGKLADALRRCGDEIQQSGCERILYYSTGWLSVLGTSLQAGTNLRGMHVDENWYELGDLPFDFKVDLDFVRQVAPALREAGFALAEVDFEGFPVDTPTIVADRLINPGRLKVGMISSHVYLDYAGTKKLGRAVAAAIAASGKRTAVVGVTSLSSRYFTHQLGYAQDAIRDAEDDRWNRRILEIIESGSLSQVDDLAIEFAQQAKADMGFKAFAFLHGVMSAHGADWRGRARAYGPIYGTGAAVVDFASN
jgi:2-aminophenol/2-amino-5-chlorophenol 1,6-dioxygenase alpha subunit